MSEEIDVGLIFPSPRARPLIKTNVARLADSIQQIGLINAISVRKVVRHRGTTPFDAYEIVNGHHRYRAALDMKWRTVRCEIVVHEALMAEMAEIDENLIRADLTPSQAAAAIARRKAIYETLHPETKHGGDRKSDQVRNLQSRSFINATAGATGKDKSTISRAAARGAALGEDLDAIYGTSLDKGAEMDALAKMEPKERKEIIERAKAGEKVSALKQQAACESPTFSATIDKQVERLVSAWAAAGEQARQKFLLHIERPSVDQRSA